MAVIFEQPLAQRKSGRAILGDFGGSPLFATVTFDTAFADDEYSVLCEVVSVGRTFVTKVTNKTAAGFEVHLCTSTPFGLVQVEWTASPFGEV